MCGIRNSRTTPAPNDLRITAGGHFLVVIVVRYHTRGSHDRGIKIVDPGSSFHRNDFCRLISQESLSSSLEAL